MFPRDRVIGSLRRYEIPFDESETTEALREKLAEFYARRTITRKPILPADCANAILWLAGDQSAKTTGHIIPVDGGLPEAFLGKGDTRRRSRAPIVRRGFKTALQSVTRVTIRAVQQFAAPGVEPPRPLRDRGRNSVYSMNCSPAAVHRVSIERPARRNETMENVKHIVLRAINAVNGIRDAVYLDYQRLELPCKARDRS